MTDTCERTRRKRYQVFSLSESRIKKLLRAAEIIRDQSEQETELDQLVAVSMQTGYQLGKMSNKAATA